MKCILFLNCYLSKLVVFFGYFDEIVICDVGLLVLLGVLVIDLVVLLGILCFFDVMEVLFYEFIVE